MKYFLQGGLNRISVMLASILQIGREQRYEAVPLETECYGPARTHKSSC